MAASTSSPLVSPIERIQHGAGEMPCPREPFHAGDQRIFVSAMERIARLESDDALPAALGEQRPRFARRQHELAILGMLRLRQHAHLAAQQHLARIVHGHGAAGMIGALGAVDALDVLGLIPGKDVVDGQRADDFVLAVDQGDRLTDFEGRSQRLVHRETDGNGPGVVLAVVDNDFAVQNAVEGGLVHRAGQRAEAAVAEAIEAGEIGIADRTLS